MSNIYFNGALKLNAISSEINKPVKITLQVKAQQYSKKKVVKVHHFILKGK